MTLKIPGMSSVRKKLILLNLLFLMSFSFLLSSCEFNKVPDNITFTDLRPVGKDTPIEFEIKDDKVHYYSQARSKVIVQPLTIKESHNLYLLRDSVVFRFSQPVRDCDISLVPVSKVVTANFLGTYKPYDIKIDTIRKTATLVFSNYAKNILSAIEGYKLKFVLEIEAKEEGYNFPLYSRFYSNPFEEGKATLKESIIENAVVLGLTLVSINVILLVLSIWIPWFRANIFGENLLSLLGLFSIKGLITKPLLIWIKPLKIKVLSQYRRELSQRPDFLQWQQKTYNNPQIGSYDSKNVTDNLLKDILQSPMHRVWFIEGRSGLGKTALLEQLTLKMLNYDKTPLYIKLNSFSNAGTAIKNELEFYGQLSVDDGTALELVKTGGFYILLDGLNEAKDVEFVRLFVKSILRNNTVIISSQFEADWPEVEIKLIDLKPFGIRQLASLINNESLMNKLIEAKYLFDLNFGYESRINSADNELMLLPFTATLIKEYINKNNNIPTSRLNIYEMLLKDLKTSQQYLNFENKSWEMFCNNSQNIQPDNLNDNLDKVFLQKARQKQVLTEYGVNGELFYRFRHDRVYRFIVAEFLYRLYKIPKFEDLHSKLLKGQDRMYWIDVIEFVGELLVNDAKITLDTKDCKRFLLEIGAFEPVILKKRLIVQWESLNTQIPRSNDTEFANALIAIISREGRMI